MARGRRQVSLVHRKQIDVDRECNLNGCIRFMQLRPPMASVTIKGIPDELLDRLRKRAETDKRSINREVIHLLETALSDGDLAEPTRLSRQVQRQVRMWKRISGKWRSTQSVAEEIDSIYASRTTGRDVSL